jgi:hypothetical protein
VTRELSLDELWDPVLPGDRVFHPDQASDLPKAARRYLEHALAAGTQLASAVRLHMHGEIKLQRWLEFRAEQVIRWNHGMIWSASVRMHGMPIRGSDRLVGREGAMQWKLFGLVPVMSACGPDISRSTAGRVAAESVWVPSVLCGDDISWTATDPSHAHARFEVQDETAELDLTVDEAGRLETLKLQRWGNPDGGEFQHVDFGAIGEEEATFGGYTIPTRLRAGWHFDRDRFESEGEFFRVVIDHALYR